MDKLALPLYLTAALFATQLLDFYSTRTIILKD